MGTKWSGSGFTSQTSFGTTDEVVGLVGGANSRVTRKVFIQGADTPADGDTLRYDANAATPTYLSVNPRWRIIPLANYTSAAPTSTSAMAFTGATAATSATSYFAVGSPIRFKQSGTTYYAVCTSVTSTSVVITGAPFIAATAFTELAVGNPEMVQHVPITVPYAGYAASTGTAITRRSTVRWRGRPAYLVSWSATHNTATAPAINLQINGTNVGTSALTISSTPGTVTNQSAVAIDATAYAVSQDQNILVNITSAVASSDYLAVTCVFVIG